LSDLSDSPPVEAGSHARPRRKDSTVFHVYARSIELIRALRPLIGRLEKRDKDLARQLRRAASSIPLNIAEGNRRTGRDKSYHFRVAAGSAAESSAALEVAQAWGHLEDTSTALDLLDQIRAMLWTLSKR